MKVPHIDDRNWSSLTAGERRRQLEVEGYAVLPNVLSADTVSRLKEQTSRLKTFGADYSAAKQVCENIEFVGGAVTDLIGQPKTLDFLRLILGDEIIFISIDYQRCEPGFPGISLHTDGQPYGSQIFGYEGSSPVIVRVLYYLDDLTPEVSPFRVVPRSHLSLHADANPYLRYESHPDEVMVTLKAGSALFLHTRAFHGNYANTGTCSRSLIALAYRPAWAGPIHEVEQWDPDQMARLPNYVRPLFQDRNTRHWKFDGGNKPSGMKSDAEGINVSRWEQI